MSSWAVVLTCLMMLRRLHSWWGQVFRKQSQSWDQWSRRWPKPRMTTWQLFQRIVAQLDEACTSWEDWSSSRRREARWHMLPSIPNRCWWALEEFVLRAWSCKTQRTRKRSRLWRWLELGWTLVQAEMQHDDDHVWWIQQQLGKLAFLSQLTRLMNRGIRLPMVTATLKVRKVTMSWNHDTLLTVKKSGLFGLTPSK